MGVAGLSCIIWNCKYKFRTLSIGLWLSDNHQDVGNMIVQYIYLDRTELCALSAQHGLPCCPNSVILQHIKHAPFLKCCTNWHCNNYSKIEKYVLLLFDYSGPVTLRDLAQSRFFTLWPYSEFNSKFLTISIRLNNKVQSLSLGGKQKKDFVTLQHWILECYNIKC